MQVTEASNNNNNKTEERQSNMKYRKNVLLSPHLFSAWSMVSSLSVVRLSFSVWLRLSSRVDWKCFIHLFLFLFSSFFAVSIALAALLLLLLLLTFLSFYYYFVFLIR